MGDSFFSAEAIRLRKADIGCRLRLTYTPVRSDMVVGEPVSAVSEPVTQGKSLKASQRIAACHDSL
jgi:hypothetical protein